MRIAIIVFSLIVALSPAAWAQAPTGIIFDTDMAVPPPGRRARTPRESASVLSVKSWVTSGVTSKPTTKALS